MIQTKISLREEEAAFLDRHRALGFKDKSSMVRQALRNFQRQKEGERLRESAQIYAELYEEDTELASLTDSAMEDWPE
jgi:Arc/MetJ-type ribon-helix-helix transcriptional regulator